ncbi:class I SAM-dependent methyltransferase [Bacteroidota bacterium]
MTRIEKRFVNRKKKSERNIKKLELAFKYIDTKKIKVVLELGCGIGFVSHYLAENYDIKVYGTDYDDKQIQIANKLQPKIDNLFFRVEDGARLSFEDSSVDLVISQNVFHHIPEWDKTIKEVARVLCSGGYFVWLDLALPRIVKTIFLPFTKNYGLYTIADIEKAFEIHEFNKLFNERLSHGPLSQYHYVLQHN